MSQHKTNIHYGSSKLLCFWYVSPFCLEKEVAISIFAALHPSHCHLLPLNTYCVPRCRHADADAGRQSTALLLRGSVTDVPAGTIWLFVELMPFCLWSAVSSKSLFSLSLKSWKWTAGILRPYTAVSSHRPAHFPWSKQICAYNKPQALCYCDQWCPITSSFQRPKKPQTSKNRYPTSIVTLNTV